MSAALPAFHEMQECIRAWPDAGKLEGPKGVDRVAQSCLHLLLSSQSMPSLSQAYLAGIQEPVWAMSASNGVCTQ